MTDRGSSTLTASNYTGSLLWSTGATTPSINVTISATYTVKQIINGCSSIPVSAGASPKAVPLAPSVSVTNDCGSSLLTASNYTGTLSWNTGATTPSISESDPGTYSVTQTAVNGCTSPAASGTAAPKTIPAAPVINANGPTVFCAGGSVVLTSSEANGNVWSTGSTDQSITVTTSGIYTVRFAAANGCTSPLSAPMTVTVNQPSGSSVDVTVCSGLLPFNWNNNTYFGDRNIYRAFN